MWFLLGSPITCFWSLKVALWAGGPVGGTLSRFLSTVLKLVCCFFVVLIRLNYGFGVCFLLLSESLSFQPPQAFWASTVNVYKYIFCMYAFPNDLQKIDVIFIYCSGCFVSILYFWYVLCKTRVLCKYSYLETFLVCVCVCFIQPNTYLSSMVLSPFTTQQQQFVSICVNFDIRIITTVKLWAEERADVSMVTCRPRPCSYATCLFPDPWGSCVTRPSDPRPAAEMLEETVGLAAVTILGILEQGERNSGYKKKSMLRVKVGDKTTNN